MKELVVISGKGGTGKTSVVAAFAAIAARGFKAVFADCDVDAADLHLILSPEIRERNEFVSGREAIIDVDACSRCGVCAGLCRFDAVERAGDGSYRISGCEGCGVCVRYCPAKAISFPERRCGEWYVSDTRFGPLVHARLDAGAENSGKLVSLVRKRAREKAGEIGADYVIVDGGPGVGCPVIASITGADAALAVTEPSLSGLRDLERVIDLAAHFKVPLSVAINKFDINPELSLSIKKACETMGVVVAGFIGYDTEISSAQIRGQSIVEYNEHASASEQIAAVWQSLNTFERRK